MVERLLAKEEVAGSTPVFRSTLTTSRALATSALVAQARARDAGCDAAEVAEWQTRRSQKPLGFTARVGSSPTFGTRSLTVSDLLKVLLAAAAEESALAVNGSVQPTESLDVLQRGSADARTP